MEWVYIPPYIEIHLQGFSLDRADDPNHPEAPRLIRTKIGLVKQIAEKIGLRKNYKNEALKVPVTIHNLEQLFKRPKKGHPSQYHYVWNKIFEQHGDQRIPAGWVCMRRNVIGTNLLFIEQQAVAKLSAVIISELGARVLFNFLEYVRSGTYPDGFQTAARTATLTLDSEGNDWPSSCRAGELHGLELYKTHITPGRRIGVSVILS